MVFNVFLMYFGCPIFDVCSYFVKIARPYEYAANSSQSRVGYLSKQLKCITKNLEKHGVRTMRKKHVFWVGLGLILGAIWHHFGTQNALKNLMKICKRFWTKKKG